MGYLLGLRTEAGPEDEDLFLVFCFWELEGFGGGFWFLFGEEGFAFFFAGELDGEVSFSVSWLVESCKRCGLLIPLRISLMFELSSCDNGC